MAKTLHYSMAEPHSWEDGGQRYVMFSFFSFTDGKYRPGQCQSVPEHLVAAEREALEKGGWTHANAKYLDGKWTLCAA
jgi:hypothetical protein